MDSDYGARVNEHLVMVSSPWLQYYVTAASFFVFGQNTFAARCAFALAGLATVCVVYFLATAAAADIRAGICATMLMLTSVQFLLFCRQSRYYAIAMFLTCLLIASFLRMRTTKWALLFAVCAILLFHAHPIGIFPVIALGVLTFVDPAFLPQRRWFLRTLVPILLFTVPWFALARQGYGENAALPPSAREFALRILQYLIECVSVTPICGAVALVVATALVLRRSGRQFPRRQRDLLVAILVVIVTFALAMAATQRTAALWVTGVRYTSAIIPLVAVATGVLMSTIANRRNWIVISLFVVFAFTKLPQITPWIFWADKNPDPENKIVALHVPSTVLNAFVPMEDLFFLRELRQPSVGTVGESAQFLQQHANRNDFVITNYESEPLYFHTQLPQPMKIMKQDPIFDAARRYGLPDYVFGVDHARWVVWRFNWDDYLGIRWPEVADALLREGAHINPVAEIKETGWENRENIHFHRFPGDHYLFAHETNLEPARIFRVDWPEAP
jgi:uncharacterized membrane protein YuzA (DUF378 family)